MNGRAYVNVGDSWEDKHAGIIDPFGNFIEGPSPAEDSWLWHDGDYTHFNDVSSSGVQLIGLKDRAGEIIIPAEYSLINLPSPYDQGVTLVIGTLHEKLDCSSHWIIDLLSGDAKEISFEDAVVRSANIVSNNWCIVTYSKPLPGSAQDNGIALLKDDLIYMFYAPDHGYSNLFVSHIRDDLFALNYSSYTQNNQTILQTDLFNAASGVVMKSLHGYNYSHSFEDTMMIFQYYSNLGISRQLLLNFDFEPFFSVDVLDGESIWDIRYIADDVYSLRTTFYSGLIKENGKWLIRVYINNLD
jgi:hypothetical protein